MVVVSALAAVMLALGGRLGEVGGRWRGGGVPYHLTALGLQSSPPGSACGHTFGNLSFIGCDCCKGFVWTVYFFPFVVHPSFPPFFSFLLRIVCVCYVTSCSLLQVIEHCITEIQTSENTGATPSPIISRNLSEFPLLIHPFLPSICCIYIRCP